MFTRPHWKREGWHGGTFMATSSNAEQHPGGAAADPEQGGVYVASQTVTKYCLCRTQEKYTTGSVAGVG